MRGHRFLARWSGRLLRRERRQLGLIAALVALAVGIGVTGVLVTFNLAEPPERADGGGQVRATVAGDASEQRAAFAARFDPSDLGEVATASVPVPGSTDRVELRAQDEDDEVAAPLVSVVDGRWPGPGEVAVTEGLAEHLGVGMGDELALEPGPLAVVGVVENPTDLADDFALVADPDDAGVDPDLVTTAFLLDAPVAEVEAASVGSLGVESTAGGEVRSIAAGAVSVVVAVVMLQVALLAGAGFAVVSRRRSRHYGLLAAAGATPRQVRRVATGTGLLVGAAGSLLGAAAALALVGAIVPGMEEVAGHRIDLELPWWGVAPSVLLGVAAATLAAWWPARALARRPITEVLAAQRPRPAPTRHPTAAGLLLGAAGTASLLAGANRASAALVVLGGVAAVVGLLLLAPAAAQLVGRVATHLPLAARLAGRDVARHQGRSAAVVAAVAVAVGLATAIASTTALVDRREADEPTNLPEHAAVVWLDLPADDPLLVPTGLGADQEAATERSLERSFADLDVVPVEVPVDPDAPVAAAELVRAGTAPAVMPELLLRPARPDADDVVGFGDVDRDGEPVDYEADPLWVGSDAMLSAWDIEPPATWDARQGAVLAAQDGVVTTGERNEPEGQRTPVETGADLPDNRSVARGFLSPAAVEAAGLESATVGWIVLDPDGEPLTDEVRDRVRQEGGELGVVELRDPPPTTVGVRASAALVAMVVGLVVLVAAVSLTRTESARDLRLLTAVGASPATRRWVGAATAALLASAGAALGVVLGALPQLTMLAGPGAARTPAVPWIELAVVLVAFPVLAGLLLAAGRGADDPDELARIGG